MPSTLKRGVKSIMYAIQSSAGRCTNHKEKPRSFTDHELFIEEELEIEEDLPPGPVHSLWLLKVVLACALHDSNSLFAFPYAIFIPRIHQSSPLDLFVCIAGCTTMRILLYVGACTRVFMHKFTTSLTLLMLQMT